MGIVRTSTFTPSEMGSLYKTLSRRVKRFELIFKRDSCVRQRYKDFIFQSVVKRLDYCYIEYRLEISNLVLMMKKANHTC